MASSNLTKKQQKAQAFRGGKKGKDKVQAEPLDVPEEDLLDENEDKNDNVAKTGDKAEGSKDGGAKSKSKRSKEKKLKERLAAEKEKENSGGAGVGAEGKSAVAAGKKRKRDDEVGEKKDGKEGEEGVEGEKVVKKTKKDVKQRFILFVGHLSYKTTSDELAAHFARETGHTPSIRLLTSKPINPSSPHPSHNAPKSRGIAFAEFPSSTALQLALKLHHTELDGKRINVELTAGGGGSKSGERKRKIVERNERVGEQRVRRKEREEEEGAGDGEGAGGKEGEEGRDPKKAKLRGGRRGKKDGDKPTTVTDGPAPLAGWAAKAAGRFATPGSGPSSAGRGRGGGRGGMGGRRSWWWGRRGQRERWREEEF